MQSILKTRTVVRALVLDAIGVQVATCSSGGNAKPWSAINHCVVHICIFGDGKLDIIFMSDPNPGLTLMSDPNANPDQWVSQNVLKPIPACTVH